MSKFKIKSYKSTRRHRVQNETEALSKRNLFTILTFTLTKEKPKETDTYDAFYHTQTQLCNISTFKKEIVHNLH